MKVIHIIFTTTGYKASGAVTAAQLLATELNKSIDVVILIMSQNSFKRNDSSVPVHEVKSTAGLLDFSFVPKKVKNLFSSCDFMPYIEAEKPDLVHFHNPIPPLALYKTAKSCSRKNIKYVITSHGFNEIINFREAFNLSWLYIPVIKYLIHQPIKFVIKNAACLFLLSKHEIQDLKFFLNVSHFDYKITPNGYPSILDTLEINDSVKLKPLLADGRKIILYLGNHTKNKGIDTLLECTNFLKQKYNVVVGGKIRKDNNLQNTSQCSNLSAKQNIIFTDFLTDKEKFYLLKNCDILVHPTRADTLPLSIIEAMFFEKPVVSTNIGGIPSLVDEQTGILIEPNQPLLLAEAIETILNDPIKCKKMGKKAKEKITNTFTWSQTATKTLKAYKAIVS